MYNIVPIFLDLPFYITVKVEVKYIRRSFGLRINIIYVWHTQYKKYSHLKQNLHKYPWTYSHNQISSLWNIFVFRIMSYIFFFITLLKRYYLKPCRTDGICYLIGLGTKVVTYMSPTVNKHTVPSITCNRL